MLIGWASVILIGAAAQWLAWRCRVPSILLLLLSGLFFGPVLGWINPQELFGEQISPFVPLAVAVILFEGGLSLRFREIRDIHGVVWRLTTIGALVTWGVGTFAAWGILGMAWPIACLLAAILVVTGPTVIAPMLRHLRLGGDAAAILRWESIIVDPIGATLAVIVFSLIPVEDAGDATSFAVRELMATVVVGGGLGMFGAGLLYALFRNYWVPDRLQSLTVLAIVLMAFALANSLQDESGLLAVTILGILLANQRGVSIKHIIEFKENLTVLLLSSLFIILAARLRLEDLRALDWRIGVFVFILIAVARPLSVLISTWGSRLGWKERLMVCLLAPRGIVAVAVTSVFADRLMDSGFSEADQLPAIMFVVVVGTVFFYSVVAGRVAVRLGLAKPNPQGVVIVGAHAWARALAERLIEARCRVLLIDASWENVSQARLAGLPVHFGNVLSETSKEEIDFSEMGKLVALTPNNEVNSLACLQFVEMFGRREVYQLAPAVTGPADREPLAAEHLGRVLWRNSAHHAFFEGELGRSLQIASTRLSREFPYTAFLDRHGDRAIPLFLVKEQGEVVVFTTDNHPSAQPGHTLISAVPLSLPTARNPSSE